MVEDKKKLQAGFDDEFMAGLKREEKRKKRRKQETDPGRNRSIYACIFVLFEESDQSSPDTVDTENGVSVMMLPGNSSPWSPYVPEVRPPTFCRPTDGLLFNIFSKSL
jgi:hypothetical protein